MSIPMPPTDNLYKFMAIGGLVLIIGSEALFTLALREWSAKLHELEPSLESLEIDVARLKRQSAEFHRQAEASPPTKKALDQLRKHHEAIQEVEDNLLIKAAEVKARARHLDALRRDVRVLRWLTPIAGVFGALLTLWGFVLWYTRVQIHLDRVLKEQAASGNAPCSGNAPWQSPQKSASEQKTGQPSQG